MHWLNHTFRSLRHRNYRLYFIGQTVSLVGTWMQTTAIGWLSFHLTGESRWTAAVFAANMLPSLFLGPWAGALADRWPKRRLIMLSQTAFIVPALVLTLLAATGVVQPWHLLAAATLNGCILAIDMPARLAFVIDLVGRDDLPNAIALNALLFNVARAAGPALGGVVLAVVSPAACFAFNAVSYAAVLGALAAIDARGEPHPKADHAGWQSVLSGFRFLGGQPRLALVVLLVLTLAVLAWPFLSLMPAMAAIVLDGDGWGYSLLVSGTGCGALAAAIFVAGLATDVRRQYLLASGVVLTALGLVALSLCGGLAAAVACCALTGMGLILFFATGQAVLQLGADDHNRGRVLAVWSMALNGGLPLGNVLAGVAADLWGVPLVLRLQGGMLLVVAAILAAWLGLARQRENSYDHPRAPAPEDA